VNREGKSYRSTRAENGLINGSIVLVTRSEKWSPALTDWQSNFTHACLVLECPKDPSQVGREVRLDERKYRVERFPGQSSLVSSWTEDDGYVEI